MSYRIAIPERIKPLLEEMAIAHDCWHGGVPSIPKLIVLFADGKLNQGGVEQPSFYGQLITGIAQGLSSCETLADYPAGAFGQKVRDRADAILFPTDDSVYSDD